MTEAQVGFLYNISAAVTRLENDKPKTLLKSYYLMRCKDLTRGYGLPEKYFSSKIRCSHCCTEWKKNTEVKVRSVKLSKRQRQRLKSRKIKDSRNEYVRQRNNLLQSNEVEQICTFCKQSTITPVLKPQMEAIKTTATGQDDTVKNIEKENNKISNMKKPDIEKSKAAIKAMKKKEINVYANALDIFSLQNKSNALGTQEKPKVISNNKRKKDKFAGLCQKAVLASAKLKAKEGKQDKLSLFLKPSS